MQSLSASISTSSTDTFLSPTNSSQNSEFGTDGEKKLNEIKKSLIRDWVTCSAMALRNGKSLNHSSAHSTEHKCLLCNLAFPTPSELNVHSKSIHNTDSMPGLARVPVTTKNQLETNINYHCVFCIKSYIDLSETKKHIVDFHKSEVDVFYCDECGKGFFLDSLLQEHRKIHFANLPRSQAESSASGSGSRTSNEALLPNQPANSTETASGQLGTSSEQ